MPTVPPRQYPEFDAPSETHLQMAEASLRQMPKMLAEEMKKSVDYDIPKARADYRAVTSTYEATAKKFSEAQKDWPESENVQDLRRKAEHPDQWMHTGRKNPWAEMIMRLPNPDLNKLAKEGAEEFAKRKDPTEHQFNLNMARAQSGMIMSEQEENLYLHHLRNLHGSGGIDNPDGSRSTVKNISFEQGGRTYNVPTVYEGRTLTAHAAIARARRVGLDKFPSYASREEAEQRYNEMHRFMEQDTVDYMSQRGEQEPVPLPRPRPPRGR